MDIRPIDPRKDIRPEYGPIHEYRVVFWRGGSANENDISGADDVHRVIEWADAEATARRCTYTLFAKFDHGDSQGMLWLAGINPTVHSGRNFARHHP
jgi:hypothetical protein